MERLTAPPRQRARPAGNGLIMALLLLTASQWVWSQQPTPSPRGETRRVSTFDATEQNLVQREETLSALIRQEAKSQERQGRLANKQLVELAPNEAALKALRKNLSIQRSQVAERIAKAALVEAQAVFDPVVLLSFRYDRSETFTRIEQGQRLRRSTTSAAPGFEGRSVIPVDDPRDTTGTVIVFDQPRTQGSASREVAASIAPITGPTEAFNYEVALEQQLPWGARLELLYRAIDQDTFFIDNAPLLTDNPNPPLALVNFGSFERPWVSSLLTRLALPLPGSREFGRYAEQEVGIYQARFDKERAFWEVETAINDTLLEVDLAYWDLIRALLSLHATTENRALVERRLEVAKRRFELREATNYDVAQVQDEQARVRGEEERAWNNYVLASDALVQLLDLPATDVLLPKGYQDVLQRVFIDPGEKKTIASNPARLAATVDVQQARLDEATSRVRKRPDIKVLAEAEFSQRNSVFGYESFAESLGNVADPDVITQAYSIDYLYPWGNRAVKAAFRQAEAQRQRQQFLLQETENRLGRQLRDALVELASATERVSITTRNVQLASLAYEKAVSEEQARTVREVEVVAQSVQLLNAQLQSIQALAERKQAEAQVLAAIGVLGHRYAERLAQNPLERYRISLLNANGVLQYFGSPETSARQ